MESEGSRNEADVSMKLLPNEGEVPDYKSVGNEDVSLSCSHVSENVSSTDESLETLIKRMEVLLYFHNW